MEISLDNIDRLILKELQEDSSISNLNLSKKIGISPSTSLARTKNLKKIGVIKQFTTIIDEKKLGIEVIAFIMVKLSPLNRETLHNFLAEIEKLPEVQECYTLAGNHDCLLKIIAKDMQAYRDFVIDSLMKNSIISNVETSMVMGVEKRTLTVPV